MKEKRQGEILSIIASIGVETQEQLLEELKKRGISGVKAVFSTEEAVSPLPAEEDDRKGDSSRTVTPGSMAFVPAAAGLLLASEIVKDLVGGFKEESGN